jgi:hypothetical protein
MEMRVEVQRVAEGLIRDNGGVRDGPGGRSGMELSYQREDQPADEAEEPLAVSRR